MPPPTANLLLLEDLEDTETTSRLSADELKALRATADWIKAYVIQPHEDLGRPGPVCPFVPTSLEQRVLWLAPERVGDREVSDVAELLRGYQRILLDSEPPGGDNAHRVIVVVFTDVTAARAQSVFGDVLQRLTVTSYAQDGIIFGPFYPGHQGTAIHNPSFHPFRSPVPFMFVRHGVVEDWPFFLENQEMFDLWARRFGESGAHALAEPLRRLPWRVSSD